jgi:hypothetical protein
MENTQEGFNNIPNYKFPLYPDDIIRFSYSTQIDRLQFSLDNRYAGTVMSLFNSLFEYIKPIKDDKRFIHRFRHNHSLIEFVKWGRDSFYSAVIVHDPDIDIQNEISQIMLVCRMTLSQVEVAFDFFPDDKYCLRDLRRSLTEGLVLKYSRAGCYVNYSGLEYRGTEYIGNNGYVWKGAKGLRIYDKQQGGRHFLRVELQFNRPFIKRRHISLPVDADGFSLFDFVDYREPLDEDRLLRVLCKKWANPIKRAADVDMLRSLLFRQIHSWISSLILCPSDSVSDEISNFKQSLRHDNLVHRINEFFPKSNKKAMILADMRRGFVRREY